MKEIKRQWRQRWPLFQLCCGLLCLTAGSMPALADGSSQKGSASLRHEPIPPQVPGGNGNINQRLQQAIEQADIKEFDRLTGGDTSHNQLGMDASGRTALMYAAKMGKLETVHKLIRLNSKGAWDWNNKTYHGAPHLRGSSRPLSVSDYINLCDLAREEASDPTYGYTALMYACDNKHIAIVNYLLNAGADPTRKCKFAQFTALQLAQNAGDALSAAAIDKKLNEDLHHVSNTQWWTSFLSSPSNFTTPLFAFIGWLLYLIYWKLCWEIRAARVRRNIQERVKSDTTIHPSDKKPKSEAITKEFLQDSYFRNHRKVTPDYVRSDDVKHIKENYDRVRNSLSVGSAGDFPPMLEANGEV